jgi:pimeloyl-ACP methyl ester carboxylesterase
VPPADTAVVLLHGQPSTHITWLPTRRLLPTGDILNPDRPGYGANPAAPTDYPGNVDWLIRLLDQASVPRAVLVGHSWAGGIATLAAARYPERVAGLVLVASVGPQCLLLQDHPLGWPLVGNALAYLGLGAARSLVRHRALHELHHRIARSDLDEVDESLQAQFDRPVWRSFLFEQRALLAQLPELDAILPAVAAPTVVLTGTADSLIPEQTPRLLASQITGAELRIVPRVGHMFPLDAPDVVARAVMDVLVRANRTRPR